MKKDYNITKTKLIIWDLDETLWYGTLSETDVVFKLEILDFIRELTLKGIVNSICSKNNFEDVKNKFINSGFKDIWDMFVFPSIDWKPKGARVQDIIKTMNLREENVIFIDDNISNINEVKYYCPKIMSALPEQTVKMSEELYLVNDYDFEYTRLKQYKILEEKEKDRTKYNFTNEEFLKESKIKISIKKDCKQNIKRIAELIQRTNQLNFTKSRIDEHELEIIFSKPDLYDSAYIIAEDKYGNYGICGFYVLNKDKNRLEHFLFSCRIMNMGIEQFIYSYLGSPDMEIKGEVASNLQQKSDWVEIVDNLEIKTTKPAARNDINILFKGPCDLFSTINYINADCNIDTEFPYWNKKLIYILAHTHTAFIEQTHRFSDEKLAELSKRFPFPDADEFKTKFFDKKYNIIFLSLMTVTHSGLYINKNDGSYVLFGYADCDITDTNNWERLLNTIPEAARTQNLVMLEQFRKEYEFAGNPPVETILKNLKYIRENLDDKTKLVLILGSEIPTEKYQDGYKDMAARHKILNSTVRVFSKDYSNIDIIEITDLIQNDDDYTVCINHFSRRVYLELAKKIIEISNNKLKTPCLSLNADG